MVATQDTLNHSEVHVKEEPKDDVPIKKEVQVKVEPKDMEYSTLNHDDICRGTRHKSHDHALSLIQRTDCDSIICDLCSKVFQGRSWHCIEGCDFDICIECVDRDALDRSEKNEQHINRNHSVTKRMKVRMRSTSRRKRIKLIDTSSKLKRRVRLIHECNICFKRFPSSNALGGHKAGKHRKRYGLVVRSTRSKLSKAHKRKKGRKRKRMEQEEERGKGRRKIPRLSYKGTCESGSESESEFEPDKNHESGNKKVKNESFRKLYKRGKDYNNLRCEECNDTFRFLWEFIQHMKMQHDEEQPFKCHLCPRKYDSRMSLMGHYEWKHK